MFPVMIRPASGVRRSEFQEHMESNGIDTRMVWTGNVTANRRSLRSSGGSPKAGFPIPTV